MLDCFGLVGWLACWCCYPVEVVPVGPRRSGGVCLSLGMLEEENSPRVVTGMSGLKLARLFSVIGDGQDRLYETPRQLPLLVLPFLC